MVRTFSTLSDVRDYFGVTLGEMKGLTQSDRQELKELLDIQNNLG